MRTAFWVLVVPVIENHLEWLRHATPGEPQPLLAYLYVGISLLALGLCIAQDFKDATK